MYYDKDNDKFCSTSGGWEIYPEDSRFAGTTAIELVETDSSGFVTIPISCIDEIIEGLRMAKEKSFQPRHLLASAGSAG